MNQVSHGLVDEATPDELLSCAQLLAISVVQHREKSGYVSLRRSSAQLQPAEDELEEVNLFEQGNDVLEEALEMVRAQAAKTSSVPVTQTDTEDAPAENRTQFRVRILLPIKIVLSPDAKPIDAKLEDISWGGASLHVNETEVESADSLRVMLPRPQGGLISIEAKVLRVWPHPSGDGYGVATRFSSLNTRDEAKLEKILEQLAESGDIEGQRSFARLSQRLDLQFDCEEELLSTLDDISAGGLGLTVPEPLQIGQSLQTVISSLDDRCTLKLRARVVRQDPLWLRGQTVYRVGLKFEHPSNELQRRTSELISRVTGSKNV
jgi:c-di-GMP-binding flagellar brake protein YcgR